METSILNTIKPILGVMINDDAFDTEIITHINSSIMKLTQVGIGPEIGFRITGSDETWDDFILDDQIDMEGVKSMIALDTRIVFDPPTPAYVLTAMKDQVSEYIWRLNLQAEWEGLDE